jgi:DNA polymerase-3 subunit gamma/tau
VASETVPEQSVPAQTLPAKQAPTAEQTPPAGPPRASRAEQNPAETLPSLYRRHRPRTFAEVVGQEAVVRTLQHAVERGQVHHAYLFVGSRGTGKTSMAKILAACLNCERAPTVEPCGVCEACVGIARATSLDVHEMDAASNNSVDDIRELRDSVAYAPVSGGQKVYILDEAHMLSTAAWNAFLKTLEEPPPRTVFVLATTEAARVPATVVDRCHRFDFQRPTVEQLAFVVRRAAAAEQIEIPPEAVAAVARAATGSFRDALGTLEQLVTYSGPTIVLEDVLAVLGVTDVAVLEEVLDAVHAGDARAVLLAVAAAADSGRDAAALAGDLEVRARELLVAQVLGEVPTELALTPEADARLLEQAARVGATTTVRLLELLGTALEGVRAGADPRTQLELALVKAARPEVDGSVKALTARLERLEGRPAEGEGEGPPVAARGGREVEARTAVEVPPPLEATPAGGPASPTGASHTAAESLPAVGAPARPTPAGTLPTDSAPVAAIQAAGPPSIALAGEGSAAPPAAVPPPTEGSAAPPAAVPPPTEGSAAPPAAVPPPTERSAAPPAAVPPPTERSAAPPAAVPPPTERSAAPPAVAPPPAEEPAAAALSDTPLALASLCELWPAVVEAVRAPNAMLAAAITAARPVELSGDELLVAFDPGASFMMKKASHPDARTLVATALRELTGRRLRPTYELRPLDAEPGSEGGGHTEEEWVARFMDELDAEELPGEWAAPGEAAPGKAVTSEPAPGEAVISDTVLPSEKAE